MNLRIAESDRALFDLAAEALGTSRSEFMLTASRKLAEATLMDRKIFPVDTATWDAFLAALDSPAPETRKGLEKLRAAPLPWED